MTDNAGKVGESPAEANVEKPEDEEEKTNKADKADEPVQVAVEATQPEKDEIKENEQEAELEKEEIKEDDQEEQQEKEELKPADEELQQLGCSWNTLFGLWGLPRQWPPGRPDRGVLQTLCAV